MDKHCKKYYGKKLNETKFLRTNPVLFFDLHSKKKFDHSQNSVRIFMNTCEEIEPNAIWNTEYN
jgi:hypothetical protein